MIYKKCFISDLHLGCKKAQADTILDFIKNNHFDELYLVGDIIDIWRLQSGAKLPKEEIQKHLNIIQKFLKIAKKGTKVYYIYGNHDEMISHFIDEDFSYGNFKISEKVEFQNNGKNI